MTRGKIFMHDLVQKVGFFGILAAASIPNPLFDLAGITCGHFLVPFWTFFGATLIGKAIVKMHIQKIFIIFVFSEQYVLAFLSFIKVMRMIRVIDDYYCSFSGCPRIRPIALWLFGRNDQEAKSKAPNWTIFRRRRKSNRQDFRVFCLRLEFFDITKFKL